MWEYGGEFTPLLGSGRGFLRAYHDGSTLGMAWNGLIFGVEATGVGTAAVAAFRSTRAAIATTKLTATGIRPLMGRMASAARAKAVGAASAVKASVTDAVGAVGDKLDGLGERFAGLFWGGKRLTEVKGAANFLDPKERAIAEYFEKLGKKVELNPFEHVAGAGRQGDALIDGIKHEFKTLDAGATANTIKNVVNNSIRKGGQARNIVIDARGAGLTKDIAEHGIAKAMGITRGLVDKIIVIGDDFTLGL